MKTKFIPALFLKNKVIRGNEGMALTAVVSKNMRQVLQTRLTIVFNQKLVILGCNFTWYGLSLQASQNIFCS